jgi:hypothetical protein
MKVHPTRSGIEGATTAMIKSISFAAAAALAVTLGMAAAVPVSAQAQGGALIIYGNDRCPSGTICVRAPEADRYRIPPSLRSSEVPAGQAPGRAAATSSVGGMNTGPATCSNVGGGGGSSCLRNQIQSYGAERRAKKAADAESPVPR